MRHLGLWTPFWLLLLVLLVTTPAHAAPQIIIESRIEERQVVVADGREEVRYVATEATTPGNILRFTLTYHNTGDKVATDVIVDNPIPNGTTYLNNSASTGVGMQTSFSIDGGKSYHEAGQLTYESPLPNGSAETRLASPEQYTHIRWRLATVPAGTAGAVSFEALVK